MKIAVVTLFTPEIAAYGELAARNKRDYATIQGYDLICHRATLDQSRPPAWSKVLAILRELPKYDWVFWTDADALIMNHGIRLEDLIDEQYDLLISRDKNEYNTGHMLFRNTPAAKTYLEKSYAQTQFIHHYWWEQAAMAHVLNTDKDALATKILDQRLFNSYLENYHPGDFVIHFPRPLEKIRRMAAFYRRTSLVIRSKSQWPDLIRQFRLLNAGLEVTTESPESFTDASLDWVFIANEPQDPRQWLTKLRIGGLIGGANQPADVRELAHSIDATLYLVDGTSPIWYLVKSSESSASQDPPIINTAASTPMPRIVVQGWRAVPHLLAIVDQYHCLDLLNRPGLFVLHQDMPFSRSDWHKREGILEPVNEIAIFHMPEALDDQNADVVYRIAMPFDFSPAKARRTIVFAAVDFRMVPPSSMAPETDLTKIHVSIVTPSRWSREGLLASGAPPQRVFVIPFGVDRAIFHPDPAKRRTRPDQPFVFHYVAGATPVEPLPMVLVALATVAEKYPHVRLILLGVDGNYPIQQTLMEAAKKLSQRQIAQIQPRLVLRENTLLHRSMAEMYQQSDVLLSPDSGSAFNTPLLEAAACGTTVICTAGGSNDEIVTDDFALRIQSRLVGITIEGVRGTALAPDFDHFVALMRRAIESPQFIASAAQAGPKHVAMKYTWESGGDKLLTVLLMR
jgi:glycosyltransferase involved in cell wall biosynthesis